MFTEDLIKNVIQDNKIKECNVNYVVKFDSLGSIEVLEEKNDLNKEKIEALESEISDLENEISELEDKVSELEEEIAELEEELNG